MITGALKSKVDAVWNTMWTGGISNPQTVMEQLTLLLFLRGLDDAQTTAERQARARGTTAARIFPEGDDGIPILDARGEEIAPGRPFADLRWKAFVALPPESMQEAAENHLVPFLRRLGTEGSALRKHMAGVRFEIPSGDRDRGPGAGQGGRPARRDRDARPRHQGRPLRVHAEPRGQRRRERPVPHAAPRHPADGRHDRAQAA